MALMPTSDSPIKYQQTPINLVAVAAQSAQVHKYTTTAISTVRRYGAIELVEYWVPRHHISRIILLM